MALFRTIHPRVALSLRASSIPATPQHESRLRPATPRPRLGFVIGCGTMDLDPGAARVRELIGPAGARHDRQPSLEDCGSMVEWNGMQDCS